MISRFLIIALLLATWFLSYSLQINIDSRFIKPTINTEARFLPSGKFLQGATLSYDELSADLLWIKAIGYFGTHYSSDKDYTWLSHLLEIITTLDPAYEEVYELGAIILSSEIGNISKSNELLLKGMNNVPVQDDRYWYLPFHIAFNNMFYIGDNRTAAHYFEIAARSHNSPRYLPLLVSRLYANTDNIALALPFLQEMISQAENEEIRQTLIRRMNDIYIKQHTNLLNRACERFKHETGQPPTTLNDLVRLNIISEIPTEPYNGHYYLEDKCIVKSSSATDDLKMHNPKPTHN